MRDEGQAVGGESRVDGWAFRTVSPLIKVYPDVSPDEWDRATDESAFLGETVSFQIAFRPPSHVALPSDLRVAVNPEARRFVELASVDLVPCDLPAFPYHDDGYERDQPGLYPDLLTPLQEGRIPVVQAGWGSLWVDVRVPPGAETRAVPVELTFRDGAGELLHRHASSVTVIPAELPPLELLNSHYIHADCLAQYYEVEVFSEEHWGILERFLVSASAMGVNATMTPLWTPSLDIERGGRRLRTQLLDITLEGERYSFDFDRLGRWLDVCRRAGIGYLEMSHFFTQWGAIATPSIFVTVDGAEVEQFGWHVAATDPRYRAFLEQLMPELLAYLAENWGLDRVAFHISDEPSGPEGIARYIQAKAMVADLLGDCVVMESLSEVAYYDEGIVPRPVVATDAVGPFLERDVPDLWVYYCVAQNQRVSNRFFALPSARNRVIGHQLFAFECAGFVHWGFNFYNSQLSRRAIDPFQDTTASGAFPGGDTFIVYPGPGGVPWESIRYKVFAQAMMDHRAMSWLTALAGRSSVMELIDTDGGSGRLAFDAFVGDPQHYIDVRREVNRRIATVLAERR